jgi:hypothetical protein
MLAELRVNLGCWKWPLQPELPERALQRIKDYLDEMANYFEAGTPSANKNSRVA